MFKKILVYAAVILFVLFSMEVVSGILFPYDMSLRKIMQPSDNPKILYELKPNAEVLFSGVFIRIPSSRIKISSQGIRDYDYPMQKDPGKFRIIVLGDSISFGWGVELEEGVSKQLEALLNGPGNKYEVINFSVPTYNMVQEVEELRTKCLAYKPDLVIFVVCDNDKEPIYDYYYPFGFLKNAPNFVFKNHLFVTLLGDYIELIRDTSFLRFGKGLEAAERAIAELVGISKENNIEVLFYRGNKDWLTGILNRHGLGRQIINSKIVFQDDPQLVIEKRDGHPNAAGHKAMAREIYDSLKGRGY